MPSCDQISNDGRNSGGPDAPGIVIADGGIGVRTDRHRPRVAAFVYGEELPAPPTLPFGRWKQAS
jgi:hypothetical protein